MIVVGHPEADEDPRAQTAAAQILDVDDTPGAADLGDVLDQASGVEVRRAGGLGRARTVQLRGAGAHQIAVYLDDVPLHGGRGGAIDLSTVPLAWLDSVTVVRGAAAAVDGGGAQGGVLRLHLRRAGLGHRARARMRFGAGGFAALDGGVVAGDLDQGLLAAASVQGAEGDFAFRDAQGEPRRRRNDDHRQAGALLHGRTEALGGELAGLIEGVALERGEPGVEQFEDLDARSAQQRGQIGLRWSRGAESWQIEAVGFGRLQGWRFTDPAPSDAAAPTDVRLRDDAQGLRVAATWLPDDHAVTLTLDGRRDAAVTRANDAEDRDEARLAGAVTAIEAWTPHRRLTLTGALRLDAAQGRDPLPIPAAGAVMRLPRGLTLRANAGRAFRDPAFDELYFRGAGLAGDPTLRPEDGWALDAAIQWLPNNRLLFEITAFHQRYDRLILFVPVSAFLLRATDDRGATLSGAELRAEVRLNRITAAAGYDRLAHAFDHAPHAPLPYRPDAAAFGALALNLRRATLHTRVRWRDAVHTDIYGVRTLPAQTTWDAGVEGDLGLGFAAGMVARNLLDATAADAVQQPLPGRSLLFEVRYDGSP